MVKVRRKFKVNPSIKKKKVFTEEQIEDYVRDRITNIATQAVDSSEHFVKSGAYITSFSLSTGAGRPRGYTLHGRPIVINKREKRDEGLSLLQKDINRISDFSTIKTLYLRNNAPHAGVVEKRYRVFAQIRNTKGLF